MSARNQGSGKKHVALMSSAVFLLVFFVTTLAIVGCAEKEIMMKDKEMMMKKEEMMKEKKMTGEKEMMQDKMMKSQ